MNALLPLALGLVAGCTGMQMLDESGGLLVESGTWELVEGDRHMTGLETQQSARLAANEFAIAFCPLGTPDEGRVEVLLKALDGQASQGGGLVWRARDGRNFYAALWDPQRAELGIYKVVDGVRKVISTKRISGPAYKWSQLGVHFRANSIAVYLQDELELEASDSAFTQGGFVGLCTTADARTLFTLFSLRRDDRDRPR